MSTTTIPSDFYENATQAVRYLQKSIARQPEQPTHEYEVEDYRDERYILRVKVEAEEKTGYVKMADERIRDLESQLAVIPELEARIDALQQTIHLTYKHKPESWRDCENPGCQLSQRILGLSDIPAEHEGDNA